MGRRTPIPPDAIHPALAFFLVVAWVAATVTVLLSLCATCNRKSSTKSSSGSPRSPPSNEEQKPAAEATAAQASEEEEEKPPPQETQEERVTVIEMAPDVATHGPLPPTVLPASASKQKLSLSFSRGLPDKLRASRRERKGGDGEDTIWKKTIILGEKCKVGSDEEEEEMVVVDENGNRQRSYRPRSPRSQQTSRNNSFAYPDETPS
ncbi:unnamed protein product [Musa acuminata var. zebrina]